VARLSPVLPGDGGGVRTMYVVYWVAIAGGTIAYLLVGLAG
jgi:hypothetical protein